MDRQHSRTGARPDTLSRRPTNASAAPSRKRRMMPIFNLVRLGLYVAVFLWTIICLAIAVHFRGLLAASDLTRFVPFAIFVCVTSILVIIMLLAFSLRKEMNPISTRVELCCLALIGTFWLALGAFLATSESEVADVACYSSDSQTVLVEDAPFSTDAYQAQYHVLEAFSLFNAILIWGFLITLLGLAVRQHLAGEKHVWYSPVTVYAWFNKYDSKKQKLPAPVTAGRSRSRGRTLRDHNEEKYTGGKDYSSRKEQRPARTSPRQQQNGSRPLWTTYSPPAKAHVQRGRPAANGGLHSADKYARDASPRR